MGKFSISCLLMFALALSGYTQTKEQKEEYIPRIDGVWKIIDVKFPGISGLDEQAAKRYLGERVEIHKGFVSSPFNECNHCGLEKSYEVHEVSKFLNKNPELKVLGIIGEKLAVNKLLFGPQRVLGLEVITINDNKTAFLPWDGAYFVLKAE